MTDAGEERDLVAGELVPDQRPLAGDGDRGGIVARAERADGGPVFGEVE